MYRLPIAVLEHNIIHEFEKIAKENAHHLEQSIAQGLVNPYIDYLLVHELPKGPSVDLDTRTIRLQESYLAFLWAFIYSNFVIYEVGVQQKILDGTFKGQIEFNTDLIIRAKKLGDWAIEFASVYCEWDENKLPNPKKHHSALEREYIEKTNSIFLKAVNFLLLHEYSHLILRHIKTVDNDCQLEQEKEADNHAFSFLVSETSTEKERLIAGLSIVLLYTSNFYLAPSVREIWQTRHPNLHDRLQVGLSRLTLKSERSKYYLYYLASIVVQEYLRKKSHAIPPKNAETAEDLFYTYLDKIDAIVSGGI